MNWKIRFEPENNKFESESLEFSSWTLKSLRMHEKNMFKFNFDSIFIYFWINHLFPFFTLICISIFEYFFFLQLIFIYLFQIQILFLRIQNFFFGFRFLFFRFRSFFYRFNLKTFRFTFGPVLPWGRGLNWEGCGIMSHRTPPSHKPGLPCLLKVSYLGFPIHRIQLPMNISIQGIVLLKSVNGELTNALFLYKK